MDRKSKRGRPRSVKPADRIVPVSFGVSSTELKLLKENAQKRGLSLSGYIYSIARPTLDALKTA